jgi:hypothetical protein
MVPSHDPISHYHSLEPRQFPIILQVVMQQLTTLPPHLTLTLELGAAAGDGRRLRIVCTNVCQLRIVQPPLSLVQIPWLEIRSIRDRQWEGLAYQVHDPEDDILMFLCADFHAALVE